MKVKTLATIGALLLSSTLAHASVYTMTCNKSKHGRLTDTVYQAKFVDVRGSKTFTINDNIPYQVVDATYTPEYVIVSGLTHFGTFTAMFVNSEDGSPFAQKMVFIDRNRERVVDACNFE